MNSETTLTAVGCCNCTGGREAQTANTLASLLEDTAVSIIIINDIAIGVRPEDEAGRELYN